MQDYGALKKVRIVIAQHEGVDYRGAIPFNKRNPAAYTSLYVLTI